MPRIVVGIFVSAALLTSCAAQQVLVPATRYFVVAGRAAGIRASDFFRLARERRLAANVLLVASDP